MTTVTHLGLPHEPEFEDVHVSAALDGFVSSVIRNVVLFIWLEQVSSTHGVTALQNSLRKHRHIMCSACNA